MKIRELKKRNPQKYKGLNIFIVGIIIAFAGAGLSMASFSLGIYIGDLGIVIAIAGIFTFFRVKK